MQLCEESSECGALRLETIPDTEGCYLKRGLEVVRRDPGGYDSGRALVELERRLV